MENGVYLRDVDFKASGLDGNSGTSSLLTGSIPSSTGVPSAMVYDTRSGGMIPALATPGASGTFSNDSFTPNNLRLSTIADQFAIATDGKALIYSVAADPQQAVILAGHAANGAIWLNNTSGHWATSSYYGTLPRPAAAANAGNKSIAHRIDTINWKPVKAVALADIPQSRNSFQYRFSRNDRDVYRKIALTPSGNNAVTDMAVDLINSLPSDPGTRGMINIGYTVAPYKYGTGMLEAETADTYLRLDNQLSRIIEAVNRYCGSDNAVIWLSGTGYAQEPAIEDKKYRLPGGEFSTRRAKSLLNAYLVARHGNGDYIAAIRGGHLFLDTHTIESRNLDPAAIAEESREFLAKMSGVDRTFTRSQILAPTDDVTRALNRAYDPKTGADIILTFAPGWQVVDDEQGSINNSQRQLRDIPSSTPLFILAHDIPATKIDSPVEVTAVAPVIADILRIRSPNGALSRPFNIH